MRVDRRKGNCGISGETSGSDVSREGVAPKVPGEKPSRLCCSSGIGVGAGRCTN